MTKDIDSLVSGRRVSQTQEALDQIETQFTLIEELYTLPEIPKPISKEHTFELVDYVAFLSEMPSWGYIGHQSEKLSRKINRFKINHTVAVNRYNKTYNSQ